MRGDAVGDLAEGQEPDAIDDLTSVADFFVWLESVSPGTGLDLMDEVG